MRILYPKWNPLRSSSMQQASVKFEMPRSEQKSLQTFLCFKRCEQTKSKIVSKLSRSSLKKVAHVCATSGKAVNRLTAMAHIFSHFFFELHTSLISFRIFVRCQRLIARNVADGFLLFSLADTFWRSSSHRWVSRGSISGLKSYYFARKKYDKR